MYGELENTVSNTRDHLRALGRPSTELDALAYIAEAVAQAMGRDRNVTVVMPRVGGAR